jgi:hypothetical protein
MYSYFPDVGSPKFHCFERYLHEQEIAKCRIDSTVTSVA